MSWFVTGRNQNVRQFSFFVTVESWCTNAVNPEDLHLGMVLVSIRAIHQHAVSYKTVPVTVHNVYSTTSTASMSDYQHGTIDFSIHHFNS